MIEIDSELLLNRLKEDIIEHFNKNGLNYLTSFHNEMSINENTDVNIIMKTLTGTITNERISYPFHLIVEVSNEYFLDVKKALTSFTITNNEELLDVKEYSNLRIKQYYSSPTVLSLFNENGTNHTTTLTIEGTFIIFSKAIFLNDINVAIEVYDEINEEDVNAPLEGIISVNYNLNKQFDGVVVKGSNGLAKNYANAIQVALVVDLDWLKGNRLHNKLLEEQFQNKVYKITYNDGFKINTFNMVIQSIIQTTTIGGTMQGRISFVIAG